MTGTLQFDVRRPDDIGLFKALTEAGEVVYRKVNRRQDESGVTDAKVLYQVELVNAGSLPPRETVTLEVDVDNVEEKLKLLNLQVKEAAGVASNPQVSHARSGQVEAKVTFDVPLATLAIIKDEIRKTGRVAKETMSQNQQAPEGKMAFGRVQLTLRNEVLVSKESGFGAQFQHGLEASLTGLAVSLRWLVIGVLFVVPWLGALWLVVFLIRKVAGRSKSEDITDQGSEETEPEAPAE